MRGVCVEFDVIPLLGGVARSAGVVPLILTEVRGFSPRTIYGRRSLPSKYDFDLKDFDFKRF
jgi:hypothetical protein